jgi:hypothetical protein
MDVLGVVCTSKKKTIKTVPEISHCQQQSYLRGRCRLSSVNTHMAKIQLGIFDLWNQLYVVMFLKDPYSIHTWILIKQEISVQNVLSTTLSSALPLVHSTHAPLCSKVLTVLHLNYLKCVYYGNSCTRIISCRVFSSLNTGSVDHPCTWPQILIHDKHCVRRIHGSSTYHIFVWMC